MATAIAKVPTVSGSKYMQQLCKHWSHKFETTFNTDQGKVVFPAATLCFTATSDDLTMTLAVTEAAALDRMESVVVEHLQRFAFREVLDVAWSRQG